MKIGLNEEPDPRVHRPWIQREPTLMHGCFLSTKPKSPKLSKTRLDDFVMGFSCEADARKVMEVLPKR